MVETAARSVKMEAPSQISQLDPQSRSSKFNKYDTCSELDAHLSKQQLFQIILPSKPSAGVLKSSSKPSTKLSNLASPRSLVTHLRLLSSEISLPARAR